MPIAMKVRMRCTADVAIAEYCCLRLAWAFGITSEEWILMSGVVLSRIMLLTTALPISTWPTIMVLLTEVQKRPWED